jgi:hypothetical protein
MFVSSKVCGFNYLSFSVMYDDPFYLSPTFPQIFNKSITKNGLETRYSMRGSAESVKSCPVFASLYSGGHAMNKLYSRMLQNVTFKASNMADATIQRDFAAGDFGMDTIDWHEVQEHYANIIENE